MLIKKPDLIKSSEITSQSIYQQRRHFLKTGLEGSMTLAAGALLPTLLYSSQAWAKKAYPDLKRQDFSDKEALTAHKKVTSYNNFYEFGTGKSDPAKNSGNFKTDAWTITIAGEAEKTGTFSLEDIIKPHPLEDRIYRLRCVETWSMVIPWVGFPLGDLIKRFKPTSKAKYVQFTTLNDEKRMPGQRHKFVLDWPYVEGLRMDEAMNPLTLLSVGLYGEVLPNQNGAPIRLVVPWKYGFKSIKSIVKIEFVSEEPKTTWNIASPSAYGFYANVNPEVSHPRWSQAKERRIGDFFKRKTLPFNGYADQVAGLYQGMDLSRHF